MKREELPNETPRKDMMREALKYYEELAAIARRHRSDIPEAIRAYYASPSSATAEEILQKYMDMSMIICPLHVVPRTVALDAMHEFAALQNKPQPTAEGAEEILHKYVHTINSDGTSLVTFMGALKAMREFAAQQQPTAEGAEEITAKQVFDKVYEFYRNMENKPAIPLEAREMIFSAMHQFATLHAQKMADKMVGEKLREELIKFDAWGYGSFTENQAIINDVDEYLKAERNENILG